MRFPGNMLSQRDLLVASAYPQKRTTVNKCTRAACSTRYARYQKKGREAVSNRPSRFVETVFGLKLRHNREMRVVFGTPLPLVGLARYMLC